MEHLRHFGLSDDPFRNEPLLAQFFESRQQRGALQRLERAVRQGRGLCVVLGEVGAGKTMVVRQLLENLEEEVFEASMLVVLQGASDARWMLTRFAKQLGVEDTGVERESLLAEVYEKLAIIREEGRRAVLIIDDAQALASPSTLAEICGLLKLEYEERRLLSLVLAGTPVLGRALSRDPVLGRRIEQRVSLESLDPETAARYLSHRITNAGGDASLLDGDAVAALHELGGGVPGLMNTLADNALFEAFLCGREQVLRTDVVRAHRDLAWDQVAESADNSADLLLQDEVPQAPLEERRAGASLQRSSEATPDFETGSGELDSALDAVFPSDEVAGSEVAPGGAPPKSEEDPEEDLLVELLDE